MGHHNISNLITTAAAIAAVTGLGLRQAFAQEEDALNALMRDLGELMQPNGQNGNGDADDADEADAVEIAEANDDADDAEPVVAVPLLPDLVANLPVVGLPAPVFADDGEDVIIDLEDGDAVEVADVADDDDPLAALLADNGDADDEVAVADDETEDFVEVVEFDDFVEDDDDEVVAPPAAAPVRAPVAPRPVVAALNLDDEIAAAAEEFANLEAMRREVEINNAFENIALARDAMGKGNFSQALNFYNTADLYLPADAVAPREEVRLGTQEAIYRQALAQYRAKAYDEALKNAELARDKGHPRAARLVDDINKLKEEPPPKDKIFEDPVYAEERPAFRQDIQDTLRRGRRYFAITDYDKALNEAEKVLRVDPFNTEAQNLRNAVGKRKQEIRDIEYKATREGMLDQVGGTWTAQERYANDSHLYEGIKKIGGQTEQSAAYKNRLAIEEKMKSIIIPVTNFRDAKIQDVKTFLEEASREYDDPNLPPERRGVNFALILNAPAQGGGARDPFGGFGGGGASDGPLINFSARFTSLHTILNTVMDIARMKYSIRDNIVKIMPMDRSDDEMTTRSYVVNAELLDVVTSVSSELANTRGNEMFPAAGGSAPAEDDPLKSLFISLGVEFPVGSYITYIPSIGRLRVFNTEENLAKFDQVLVELNVQTRMVEIEARFVEVSQETLNSLGFEWAMGTEGFGLLNAHSKVGTAPYYNSQGRFVRAHGNLAGMTPANPAYNVNGGTAYNQMNGNMSVAQRFLSNIPIGDRLPGIHSGNASGPINDKLLNFGTSVLGTPISAYLHALSQTKGSDLLSAPKVLTRPGMPAVMKVTTEIIYPRAFRVDSYVTTGDAIILATPFVEPQDFNFDSPTDIGITLEVTPEVSSEGQLISMNLNPRIVELSEWYDWGYDVLVPNSQSELRVYHLKMEVPFFSRREVQANISIYNGATVVMGGLIKEERTKIEDKIPFLGDIPYLGHFFRSTMERSEKRNLLIFVTARLVDAGGRPVQITGEN